MIVEELLQPVTHDSPAGESCRYKAEYDEAVSLGEYLVARAQLEELKRREKLPYEGDNAESDLRYAKDELAAAEVRRKQLEANIKESIGKAASPALVAKESQERCIRLLQSTGKDLEVVQQLSLAALSARGLEGFRWGVELFERMLDAFPEAVHPLPEAGDPQPQAVRAMVVGEMINGDGFLAVLRETILVETPKGRLRFRDAEVAAEAIERDPTPGALNGPAHLLDIVRADAARVRGIDPKLIDNTMLLEHFAALRGQVEAVHAGLKRLIGRFGSDLLGGDRVVKLLRSMSDMLGAQQDELGADAASAAIHAMVRIDANPASAVGGAGASVVAVNGRLASRDDARKRIIEIAAYLESSEPGHPAPLFLRRAARLLRAASYFDIVRDMTPGALEEVERLTGQSASAEPEST